MCERACVACGDGEYGKYGDATFGSGKLGGVLESQSQSQSRQGEARRRWNRVRDEDEDEVLAGVRTSASHL